MLSFIRVPVDEKTSELGLPSKPRFCGAWLHAHEMDSEEIFWMVVTAPVSEGVLAVICDDRRRGQFQEAANLAELATLSMAWH